jgi:hypothetical protein
MPTDSFTFVKIPVDESLPIEALTESVAGGLNDDALIKYARTFFAQDDQEAGNVDIVAMTIPTAENEYHCCSMYAADLPGAEARLQVNKRATQLVMACGHAQTSIRGTVFVGRACDDEQGDVWVRVDFTPSDAEPGAAWCFQARAQGGGGGSRGNLSTLSNIVGGHKLVAPQEEMFGMNGTSVSESWGSWTQDDEQVELRFPIDAAIKTKDCKIKFGKQRVGISVARQEVLQGEAFGEMDIDLCTFTLENGSGNKRELCVTLAKLQEGNAWKWPINSS